MAFKDAGAHIMLDALAAQATLASLHTGFPATDVNEITGGAPAYARKAMTWNAAAARTIDDSGAARVFDVPAGATVAAAGFRKADGTLVADVDLVDEVFAAQGTYTLTDTDLGLA